MRQNTTTVTADKFNFFVPLEFEKGSEGTNKEMRVKGVCSSAVEDTDGETLEPSGFDFSPLMTKGFFNYNHRGNIDPNAVIGEPTKAEIRNDGKDFYIEGFLYPNKQGKATYELGKTLEKYSPKRRLGWSIEGQVIERHPLNPKRILRARITGVAITPCPKNPNTLVSIMKGEYSEAFVDIEDTTIETLIKGDDNVDIEKLVDGYTEYCTKEDHTLDSRFGSEESVREYLQNRYEDQVDRVDELMEALKGKEKPEENSEKNQSQNAVDKAMMVNTDLNPESVEHKKRPALDDSGIIKKSDIYRTIVSRYSADVETAKNIYSFIQQVNEKLNNNMTQDNNITPEVLNKAYGLLDLALLKSEEGADSTDDIAEDEFEVSDTDEDEDDDQDLEKSEGGDEDEDDEDDESDEDGSDEDEDDEDIEKGEDGEDDFSDLEKALADKCSNMIKKGMAESDIKAKLSSFGLNSERVNFVYSCCIADLGPTNGGTEQTATYPAEIAKSLSEMADSLQTNMQTILDRKFGAVATLFKSADIQRTSQEQRLDALQKSLAELRDDVQKVMSTPNRKSVITGVQPVERFDKSESAGTGGSGQIVLNSRSRTEMGQLADMLFQKSEAMQEANPNHRNQRLEKAISDLEIAKTTDFAAISAELQSLNVKVI